MKKLLGYFLLMIMIIVILPLIIVRGCSTVITDIVPEDDKREEQKQEQKKEQTQAGKIKLKVYIKDKGTVEEMPLEEYIKGVVAAEMPVDFEPEALKAQAVAARTYAYGRMKKIYTPSDDIHAGAHICTDSGHCQAWIKKEDALNKWESSKASDNWKKIEKAVLDTEGQILLYENSVVNPVFHSNSGGMTENSEDVWEGTVVPYLKSVVSEGEEASAGYEVETEFTKEDIVQKLKAQYPDIKVGKEDLFDEMEVLERTDAGRVKSIKIGDKTLKGTEFRSLLGLRSTNFIIEDVDDSKLKITTKGYGHGVGMSQWGANHRAKQGDDYEEILKYYYQGVYIDSIENMELILGTKEE
jgi:stage II sporulation protein D